MSIQDQVGPILNGLPTNLPDTDPGETAEWLESLDGVIEHGGQPCPLRHVEIVGTGA